MDVGCKTLIFTKKLTIRTEKNDNRPTDKTVEVDQKVFSVATCDFSANDEEPSGLRKSMESFAKRFKSNKEHGKGKANDKLGYVLADCSKTLMPPIPSGSQTQQSSSELHFENDYQNESRQFNLMGTNTSDKGRRSPEKFTRHFDNNSQRGYLNPVSNPRRRSARLAGKPEVAQAKKSKRGRNKYLHEDLTWTAALERGQQNNSAATQMYITAGGGRGTPFGPRDIIKAPGLNKISVIPDVTVKIEKVEPPEEETENSSRSPESFSCLQPFSESHQDEFEIRVVKEEADLEDFSSELCITSCQGESENLKLELPDFPRQLNTLNCELESHALKYDFIQPNTPTSQLIVPDSIYNESVCLSGALATSTSMVTSSNPISLTQTVDNSTHPCCLLFAAVWKILGLIYDPIPYNSGIKTTPRIVLNLRLVCQHWRAGIDKYYENLSVDMHDPIFKLKAHCLHQRNLKMCKNRNGMKKLVPSTWRVFDFDSSSKIERFLNHFKDTHSLFGPLCVQRKKCRNPVLGRFVSFSGGICNGPSESQSSVTKLLEVYGRHVWYCTINIQEDISTMSRHIDSVIKWLQLMPKLKHFTWKNKLSSEEAHLKAKQYIFPQMKYLKRVHFGALTTEIADQILMANYHIDALTMQMLAPKSVELFSLKELNLELHSDNMFRSFELLSQHWPLLERIRLSLLMKDTSISWRRAMKVLERWRNTLTHVSIVLPTPPNRNPHEHSDSERLPYRLDLPRVKYLKLNLRDGFTSLDRDASLDFLSPLRESLQYLHVEYFSDYDYNFKQDSSWLWVLPSNRQMPFILDYNSNVWNVFHKLEKVYIARFRGCVKYPCYVARTYSREGWYFHRSSNGKSVHPFVNFEMGDCNLGFQNEYSCIHAPTSLKTECQLAAKDLYCAWRSLNNTEVDEDRQKKLENYFSNCISQYVKERIFASFEFYKYSNYLSNGNSKKCGICPNKYCFDNEKGFEEHWRRNHFLYGGVYKCDLVGCPEIFSSQYDVVQHRKTHGQKQIKHYYELEAIPLQSLSLPEMKQIFNWIHVDPPLRFRERRHRPGFANRLQSE